MDKKIKNLIEHKEQLFWSLQIVGWIAFSAARTLNGYAAGYEPEFIYPVIIGAVGGFWITLGLRSIYQVLRNSSISPLSLILYVTLCILLSSMLFSVVEVWSMYTLYQSDQMEWIPHGFEFIGRTLYDTFVLLTWTGLYFVINSHFELQKQKEKTLNAAAQAHQAQLKMLRYQLNPHFLFNTLNAISTLVLDKRSSEANDMLSKLSSFLRFSLVSQPLQKTTLEEEIYALSLYLDIEKVRFQDRLSLDFQVTEQAKKALIPGLLLQPLVENAIKYAIAPMEKGGTISLNAEIRDDCLHIVLSDTGPGLDGKPKDKNNLKSSGVGINNTRERLKQLYPDSHIFRLESGSPKDSLSSGVTITIQIPCETTLDALSEVAQ